MTKEIYVVYSVYYRDFGLRILPTIDVIKGAFDTVEDATKFINKQRCPWLYSYVKTTLAVREE